MSKYKMPLARFVMTLLVVLVAEAGSLQQTSWQSAEA